MTTVATSLKLPDVLKARIEKLARKAGKSPHAFVLSALEEHVAQVELAERFLEEAIAADERLQRTGVGYDAAEVHAYLTAKARGKKARRPRPKRWRE